jgi:hypothetical protein
MNSQRKTSNQLWGNVRRKLCHELFPKIENAILRSATLNRIVELAIFGCNKNMIFLVLKK